MKRFGLPIVVILVALLGLAWQYGAFSPPADTRLLMQTRLPDSAGVEQAVSQWRGQILVVNFWASWCPPCREEMPALSALHKQYQNQGVTVLGISAEDVAKTREYALAYPVSYPLLAADLDVVNLMISLGNDKGGLPYTLIIDPQGQVVKTYLGRINGPLLEKTLKPLLAANSP